VHSHFSELPRFLDEGDLVVLNTSGTLAAEVDGTGPDGEAVQIHLSTQLPAGLWTVEVRRDGQAFLGAEAGTSIELPAAAACACWRPTPPVRAGRRAPLGLAASTRPSRCTPTWPATAGPSATATCRAASRSRPTRTSTSPSPARPRCPVPGRPFTPEVLTRLVAKGVGVAPLLLHTGVASLEANEPPYAEYFRVSRPRPTGSTTPGAGRAGRGHRHHRGPRPRVGGRRAWAGAPGDGWTETVVSPEHPVRSIDGFLTGWHEPEASHLAMLEAIAGRPLLEASYAAALAEGYLWHEFGDVHLILP
jgi:S-adenosylmethionine:tRNA ribosyltransferase-isomerase